jgi:hypothetical protein
MLLFRSEEHVRRWCEQWAMDLGAMLTLERAWRLAHAWFEADRGAPEWHRRPLEEVESLFALLDFTGPFWNLRA